MTTEAAVFRSNRTAKKTFAQRMNEAVYRFKVWRLRQKCANLRKALIELPDAVYKAKADAKSQYEANVRHIAHRGEVLRLQYQHEYDETARGLAEMEAYK